MIRGQGQRANLRSARKWLLGTNLIREKNELFQVGFLKMPTFTETVGDCVQLVFWKDGDRLGNRTEDIVHNSWEACPPAGFTPLRRRRSQPESERGHTSRLWPYSQITAGVLVLNGGRAGHLSDTIDFNTPEGRMHLISVWALISN